MFYNKYAHSRKATMFSLVTELIGYLSILLGCISLYLLFTRENTLVGLLAFLLASAHISGGIFCMTYVSHKVSAKLAEKWIDENANDKTSEKKSEAQEINRCSRCRVELPNGGEICESCSEIVQAVQLQIDGIDEIIQRIKRSDLDLEFTRSLKRKTLRLLEGYKQSYIVWIDFYPSEYPMGATHCRTFTNAHGAWCIKQDDYGRNPLSQIEWHPEINYKNIAECFLNIYIKEIRK